jgi:hypothetical protein
MSWAGGRGFKVAVRQGLFRYFVRLVRGTGPTSRLIRSVGVGFGHVAERAPAHLGRGSLKAQLMRLRLLGLVFGLFIGPRNLLLLFHLFFCLDCTQLLLY